MDELTTQERSVLDQLELLVRKGDSVDEAADKLRTMFGASALVDHVLAVRTEIADAARTLSWQRAMTDPEDNSAPWYTGPSGEDLFWPGLRTVLEQDPGWAEAVPSLDMTSTDVVGLLADPHSPTIATRGLVLGHVQSGKTANFTATIAKAADAGYRLFIVLSGVHNALRRQTQLRLDSQLHDLHKTKWLQLTDETQDFGNPLKALALVAGTDLRLLAVVKKNVSRLTRLRDWLELAAKEGGLDTCPVLIIDDESDQASPNASKNPELDRTKINQRIVELLALPRVAYVGYTATPFANVLINPADAADMYPRDFIYALPKPPSYFGSTELFGRTVSEDEESPDDVPHDMIRLVPSEEAAQHKVSGSRPFDPLVTETLGDAIRWFLLATAARRARSGVKKHSSMLIHTTVRVEPQLQYLPIIRDYVKGLRAEWDGGERDKWRQQWVAEAEREPSSRHGLQPVEFDDIAVHLPAVCDEAKVLADNSRSLERLIYTDAPATVIAVGGNTLSRGLTLEGLLSSYFLRTAQQYDSLLQMGRWFGYRPGYGDLPRVWTTEELADDFAFLSVVERDLRSDIDRYSVEGVSPRELAVRIRLHPRMQVTASNKMHFAVASEASFSGQRPQTTYFHHQDTAEITSNRTAAKSLISRALSDGAPLETQESRHLVRGVSAESIIEFLEAFAFHPDTDLRPQLLADYISDQRSYGALELWNIAVISRRGNGPTVDLGLGQPVRLITRSRLSRSSSPITANIGTLMSKPDRVADLDLGSDVAKMSDIELLNHRTESGRGLLLLYPIDKDSEPKDSGRKHRSPLDAADHLTGLALAFPRAAAGSEPTDMIQVNLENAPTAVEVDESLDDYQDVEGARDDVDLGDG
jgi:hypothetical protein